MYKAQKTKGFTIIEVVLVLAIAGLIFLMVFIALPALQRSQRDNDRKKDVSAVLAAVNSYEANNNGAFPNTSQLQSYVSGLSSSTVIGNVTVGTAGATSVIATDGSITVIQKMKCSSVSGATATLVSGTTRQYAAVTLLEVNGTPQAFCLNN